MKTRNLILMAALAAAGLTGVTGALLTPAVAVAAEGQKISAKMSKPINAAQEAIKAKDWDAALASLDAARAIESKSPYDAFVIDELAWYPLIQKKDYTAAADALARTVDSGFVPPTELPRRYKNLAQLNYEVKQYPKAVEYGKKSLELAPDDDVAVLVAQALYLSNDLAGARSFVQQASSGAAKPSEQLLLIGLRANAELNDRQGAMRSLEALIRNYPKQKYWSDLLTNQLYETKSDRDLRALYRLMADTSTLKRPEEYSEMASMLLTGGFPSEARQVLERGLAANVFSGEALKRAQAELQRAKAGADADAKELQGADAALAAAKSGNEMVAMGKLFFSVGQYPKAADAFSKGLAKGLTGDKADPDDVHALLGIALARSGNSADAPTAFGKIRDPKLAEVGNLWKLFLETGAPPAG